MMMHVSLQICKCEVLIKLTPKEWDHAVPKAKWLKCEGNYMYGQMVKCRLCFAHNNMRTL
jgi:hypothetical protein